MWGRLYGQRKGEGPYTKGQSLKIISRKEEKTDWHANRWMWFGERWTKQMQFPRDKQSPWGQLPVKGAGHPWQGQISKKGSRGTATINPACVPSCIFSVLPEEQAACSSCAAWARHDLSRSPVLLLTPFRWVHRGKKAFTVAETL